MTGLAAGGVLSRGSVDLSDQTVTARSPYLYSMVSARTRQNVFSLPLCLFVKAKVENIATPKKGIFQELLLLFSCGAVMTARLTRSLEEDRLRDSIDCIVDYNMCAVAFDFFGFSFTFIVVYFERIIVMLFNYYVCSVFLIIPKMGCVRESSKKRSPEKYSNLS